MSASEFVWDWSEDESLPHRGEYVVRRREHEVLARCGPYKRGYDEAVRIATALNVSPGLCARCGKPMSEHTPMAWCDAAAVAELRTARAERDALAARIEAALALCDRWEATNGDAMSITAVRAALSGATEPADAPRATASNGEPFTITVPKGAVNTVYRILADYEPVLDLWTYAVPTSWDLGTERGWRIGWYLNEDGVPTSLVATTWVETEPAA